MNEKDFDIDDIINSVNLGKKNNQKENEDEDEVKTDSDDEVLEGKTEDNFKDDLDDISFGAKSFLSSNLNADDKKDEIAQSKRKSIIGEDFDLSSTLKSSSEKSEDADNTEDDKLALKNNFNAKSIQNSNEIISEKSTTKKTSKKINKKKKPKKVNTSIFSGLIVVTLILMVSLCVAVGVITLGIEYTGIGGNENEVTFNIPENATTEDIAQILYDNQIIENKTLFKLAMKVKSPEAVYPGDIQLHQSMGYAAIINKLAVMRQNFETVSLTFKEGVTLLDVANLLEENEVCSANDFLFEFNKSQGFDFEKKITENADAYYSMEGFFFPDTYEFYKNDSASNVTKVVREHFEKKFTSSMYTQMENKDLTLSEVITLASIIQWEANSAEEMPKVASVFLNRLDDSDTFPSLQSDATKKYITTVISATAANEASIEYYTYSYDTYECVGLPAGPVCNPGIDAINAVLNPEKTNYYYFCNNLETGKSYFAETLEEHEKNLKEAGLA